MDCSLSKVFLLFCGPKPVMSKNDSSIGYANMSKQDLLEKYRKDVANLKENAKLLGLSDKEIRKIIKESFEELRKEECSKLTKELTKAQLFCRTISYMFLLFTILSLIAYVILNVHLPTSSIILRNVQGLTYPTLKFIRILFVPVLKLFPSLTDLYDESCLIENPYFYVADMECWPCQDVTTVLNISVVEESSLKSGSGSPFVTRSNQKEVTFETLQNLYKMNKNDLDLDARRLYSNSRIIKSPSELFSSNKVLSSKTHISWRFNKMITARIIRSLFAKPYFLSDRAGQSVERFVFIDGAKSEPYFLPNTECSYIYMIQGSGERTIILKPSKECSYHCKTLSVTLRPLDILWYNWWYWRPISLPSNNSTEPSISYLNSYC